MFVWLFIAFWRAEPDSAFFITTPFVRMLSAGVMLAAFWLLTAALVRTPPILLTAEPALAKPGSVFGIVRITRHPFLWALVLWSLMHMLNNNDPAGLSLFGYFFVLALLGTWPIDRRRARLIESERWREIRQETSNIPFGAVVCGRQKLVLAMKEIGWKVPLVALSVWVFVLTFHESFFGLPVFY